MTEACEARPCFANTSTSNTTAPTTPTPATSTLQSGDENEPVASNTDNATTDATTDNNTVAVVPPSKARGRGAAVAVPLLLILLLLGGAGYWYYRHKQNIIHGQREASVAELRRITDGAATGMMVNPISRGESLVAASSAAATATTAASTNAVDKNGDGDGDGNGGGDGRHSGYPAGGAVGAAPVVYAVPAESTGEMIIYAASNSNYADLNTVVRPADENNAYDKWEQQPPSPSTTGMPTLQETKPLETNDDYLQANDDYLHAESDGGSAAVYAVPFEVEGSGGASGNVNISSSARIVRMPNPLYQSADGAPPPVQVVRTPNPMYEAAGGNNMYDTNASSA